MAHLLAYSSPRSIGLFSRSLAPTVGQNSGLKVSTPGCSALASTPSPKQLRVVSGSYVGRRFKFVRAYSTEEPTEASQDKENKTVPPQTLAEKYNLDPSREKHLQYLEALKARRNLTEDQKKYMRHRISSSGKVILPPGHMTLKHSEGRKVVTIAGGRGWLGSCLHQELVSRGHGIFNISRSHVPNWPFASPFELQWYQVAGEQGVPDCDALVQVTGPSYLQKHNVPAKNSELVHYEARGGVTELLAHHVQRTKWPPRVFIQVSNAGIYPASSSAEYDESYAGPTGLDLIGSVNQHYEQQAKLMQDIGIRTVHIRLGHVLGDRSYIPNVHMMDKKGRAFWTRIGSGEQWMPWIHVKDAVSLITYAIENENIRGVVNGVSPDVIQQKDFAEALKAVLPYKTLKIPMPETVAHWMYPARAHLLLEGRKVIPRVAKESGFNFEDPSIQSAMESLQDHLVPIQWKNPVNKYFNPHSKDGL